MSEETLLIRLRPDASRILSFCYGHRLLRRETTETARTVGQISLVL